ncbi:hypothetical protein HanIR_Chr11g0505171 [Helianthus annuus]|nr:hypothetical protein HanIR_Chr11g0505171 [Helianthus annuus]
MTSGGDGCDKRKGNISITTHFLSLQIAISYNTFETWRQKEGRQFRTGSETQNQSSNPSSDLVAFQSPAIRTVPVTCSNRSRVPA